MQIRMPLTPWWQSLVNKIEKSQIPGWTELGAMFLNISMPDQQKIEKKLRKVEQKLKAGTSTHNYMSYTNLSENPQEVFIFLINNKMNKTSTRETLFNLVDSNCGKNKKVVGISLSTINSENPFNALSHANVVRFDKSKLYLPE